MGKIKVGVLGATGIVGQQFVRILSDHPHFEIELLAASERSAGMRYAERVTWMVSESVPESVKEMKLCSIEYAMKSDVDVFFSALPSSVAREVERELRERKKKVFSNASAFRMDEDVPIIIPEVNSEHLKLVERQLERYGGFIVTNSNCSTSGLVMVLKPLMEFGLKFVSVSTYQAISGAGVNGLSALKIHGNVIPYIAKEEEKIEKESKKILGTLHAGKIVPAEYDIAATCCRVDVKDGHLESVYMEFEKKVVPEEIAEKLRNFRGFPQRENLPSAPENPIVVHDEIDRPQPALDLYTTPSNLKKGMSVHVGRIRRVARGIALVLLVHNTIRGAAGSSVLNAETALKMGYLG